MRRTLELLSAITFLLFTTVSGNSWAATINVPADQPSIQAGINAASNGDTVLVAPGTYFENINFLGKAIVVTSSGGTAVTTINGNAAGAVATFSSGEITSSVLSGFTITNGTIATGAMGGGVAVSFASPTISGNLITGNSGCGCGSGIGVYNGAPLIQSNTITNNTPSTLCTGGGGAGINLSGSVTAVAQVLSNTISNNSCTGGDGGGIYFIGQALIENNLISGNLASGLHLEAPSAAGGGIYALFATGAVIVQNLIINNTADLGGGIFSTGDPSSPILVNNTIAGNQSTQNQGSALFLEATGSAAQLFNNLLIGEPSQNALFCGSETPTFENNDVFSSGAISILVGGSCAISTGTFGNISSDPLFADASSANYALLPGSPAIDTGLNTAPNLPVTDYYGNPRIVAGYIGDTPTVDMGAIENQTAVARPSPTPTATPTPVAFNLTVKPGSLNFGALAFGTIGLTSPSETVTVTNKKRAKREAITIESIAVGGDANGVYQLTGGSCAPGIALMPDSSCTLSISFTPLAATKSTGTLTLENNSSRKSVREVDLSGAGALPLMEYSPSKINFGKVTVGGPGVTQFETVTNPTAVPVALGSVSVGGKDPTDFSSNNPCGTVVPAFQSCSIFVSFSPTLEGKGKATLVIETTSLPITANLTLTGTGD